MKSSNLMASIFAMTALASCATEPSSPRPDLTALDAKGSGGTRVYRVTIEGDITLPASGDVFVTRSSSDPFANSDITLKNVTFSIGPLGPSGDDALCEEAYPNAFNNNGGTWPNDWNYNEGEWTGSATISAKRQIVNVSGSRPNETVQSSQSFGMTPPAASPDGSWSLTFDDALQFFGSTSTHFDRRYRCLDFRVVLTPV